jgi:hypothetical protein
MLVKINYVRPKYIHTQTHTHTHVCVIYPLAYATVPSFANNPFNWMSM